MQFVKMFKQLKNLITPNIFKPRCKRCGKEFDKKTQTFIIKEINAAYKKCGYCGFMNEIK